MSDNDIAIEMGLIDCHGDILVDDYEEEPEIEQRKEVASIVVELTPSKYLSSEERYLRAKLINNNPPSDQVVLEIFHDRYNDHDTMAIEVYCDKTFIGYIKKKGAEEDVDDFCFSDGPVLRDLTLEWKGTYFELARETSSSNDSFELAPYESRSLEKLWNWADQNDICESIFPRNFNGLVELTKLDLIDEELDDIPHEIGCLQNLDGIMIISDRLKRVPSSIGNLRELDFLWILGDRLRELPSEIGRLKKLTVLNFGGECFTEFPPEICKLRNLKYLTISESNIALLPSELSNLSKLEFLSILGNKLDSTEGFSWLSELSDLKLLELRKNELTSIPEEVFDLHKLEELKICDTKIEEISKSIRNLSNLKVLDINNNPELKALPDSIDGLTNLYHLSAFMTPLEALPESILNLTKVESLFLKEGIELPWGWWEWEDKYEIDISYWVIELKGETSSSSDSFELAPYESRSLEKLWNWADQNDICENKFPRNCDDLVELTALDLIEEELDHIPHEIGCLQNLVELTIISDRLKRVPSSIGNLRELNRLLIIGHKLRKLPSEIGKLEKLTVLSFHGECFTELPPEICGLRNLKELDIGRTSITSLPSELSSLSKLESLTIIGSELDSTGDFSWLSELSELKNLSLLTCELTSIPEEVFDLYKLEELMICHTKIEEISKSIRNLSNLKRLDISQNPELKLLPDWFWEWECKIDTATIGSIRQRVKYESQNNNRGSVQSNDNLFSLYVLIAVTLSVLLIIVLVINI